MIVEVSYKPVWIETPYNPIIWSCLSSKRDNIDFKYVFDVYVDGQLVSTVKQRPNPVGYGMIDLSTLMQGYIGQPAPDTQLVNGETSIDSSLGQYFADNKGMSRHLQLKVGEEYSLGPGQPIIPYTGVADTQGSPAYVLNAGNTTLSIPVRVLSASLEDHAQQWNMQKTSASGIWGGNPFDGNKCYDHGVNLAHALSHADRKQTLYRYDKLILSYLNWSPYPTQEERPIYGFKYSAWNATTGILINSVNVPMTTATGFAQRATSGATVPAELDPRFDIVNVLASPLQISGQLGLTPNFTNVFFTIQGYNKNFVAPVTEETEIRIAEDCIPLYPRVRVSWANDLGGRDYQNFTMFMEKTITTQADKYTQEQMNYSAATPVPMLNDSTVIKNLGVKGGDKSYNKTATTSYKIQTDWLSQSEIALLEGLQKSGQVLAYIHDPNNPISDQYAYTATVTNGAYTVKNIKQAKLVQGSFDLLITNPQKLQNL
jgi:hypothetical protein